MTASLSQSLPALSAPEMIEIGTEPRMRQLFEEHKRNIYRRTDQLFVWLMPFQWLVGLALVLWVSPKAWAGAYSTINPHVWAALFLGGLITIWPVYCAITQPGMPATRYLIAVGQMLMSALLIHLGGGRIEMHFHIFGSLAVLACYRDWRVLVVASLVTAADHFFGGIYFPLSIFGVLTASPYRWVEHTAWVVFEDLFLLIAIRQSVKEMLGIAERQATLESVNASIERTVEERTAELRMEIAERKSAEAEVERMHQQLLDASRQAGMAEVATNVLHNVGNVLNSVNTSHSVVSSKVRESAIGNVERLANMLEEHAGDLGAFLTTDRTGQKLPAFVAKLAKRLGEERDAVLVELELLGHNVEHIKEIIDVQQSHTQVGGVHQKMPISDLVEGALQINDTSMARHRIEIIREYGDAPPASLEKHKVMQILVNLISNAKHALIDHECTDRRLKLRTGCREGRIFVSVIDSGVGIAPENVTRVFAHGFTTKKNGHGFGLHSAALAAKEMGGSLTLESEGLGHGATFTLELPLSPDKEKSK